MTTAAAVVRRGTIIISVTVLGAACFALSVLFPESLRGTTQLALYVIISCGVVGGEIIKTAVRVLPLIAPLLALLVHLSPDKDAELCREQHQSQPE